MKEKWIDIVCKTCGGPGRLIADTDSFGHSCLEPEYDCTCNNIQEFIPIALPKRYMNAELIAKTNTQINIYSKCNSYVDSFNKEENNFGWGIYIFGATGMGKTYIISGIATKLMAKFRNINIKYISEVKLISQIKNCIATHSNTFDMIQCYCDSDLLVLDDIGKDRYTEFVGNALFSIIDYRWDSMLPTLYSSNYSLDQLCDRIGEEYGKSIVSRIKGNCHIYTFEGADLR